MTFELLIEAVGALAVGLALGLLGAGGSILTVPILVYLLHEPRKAAIAESLAIVGIIAGAAAARYAWQRAIDWRMAALVGAPGMLGSFLGAALATAIPASAQMLLFALVVLVAAWRMLAAQPPASASDAPAAVDITTPRPLWQAIVAGLAVGVLTGVVGVGGGFLLVPVFVLVLGLPMRTAVPTSLVVIVANSAVGFAKHVSTLAGQPAEPVHWRVVAIFATVGALSGLAGTALAQRVPQSALRTAFAWLLVAIGIAVFAGELRTLFA